MQLKSTRVWCGLPLVLRCAVLVCLWLLGAGYGIAQKAKIEKPAIGQAAPGISLPDVAGRQRSLGEFRGRPVALFFFCGCDPCHTVARLWQSVKHPADMAAVAVFSGDARGAKRFAAETGLTTEHVTYLLDPMGKALERYAVEACPHLFLLDRQSALFYTDNERGARSRITPPAQMVARAANALRALPAVPANKTAVKGLTQPGAAPSQASTPHASPAIPAPVSREDTQGLLTVRSSHIKEAARGAGRFDFGTLDPVQTPHAEHLFTLTNETQAPIKIANVKGSCGCETIALLRGGVDRVSATLGPGESAQIRVAINTAAFRNGARKYVWAYGPDSSTPLATLELIGEVRDRITFRPSVLQFDRSVHGGERSLPLDVTVDASLLGSDTALPPLVSSRPEFKVVPNKTGQRISRNGRSVFRQSYRVILTSNTQAGSITGSLSFRANARAGANGIRAASVPVSVVVGGRLIAAPASLQFGRISRGNTVVRPIILSGVSFDQMNSAVAACDNKWLSVRVAEIENSGGGGTQFRRLLLVSLRPDAPGGSLQAKLTVTTKSGERVVIPVSATLVSPK